ncbi:MAG TPA: FG-GAP-like repeat-containing protein [Pyrinomonadaceae bacterium]|jgi:hypothetical protein
MHNRKYFARLLSLTLALLLTAASMFTLPTYSESHPTISAVTSVSTTGSSASVKLYSPVPTKDLAYSRATGMMYASMPSTHRAYPNTVTPFHPITNAVTYSISVGSEPGKLAISEDGLDIYVALDGAGSVCYFYVGSRTPGYTFSLGNSATNGPMYVEDMEVLPGSWYSVAISRRNQGFSPRHEGVAIYDNGVMRPNTTPTHTGSNAIEFSASASTLYGYNNETSEFGLRKMAVNSSGVSVSNTTQNLITGYNVDIKFSNGLIYTTSGRVINPETRALVGTFTLDSQFGNLVLPDAKTGRVYFLTGSGATTTLRAFDQRTFAPLGSVSIPSASGTASSLIRWGTNGLAFRTSSDQVFMIRTPLVTANKPVSDYDGDNKTDLAVWRAGEGMWYVQQSTTEGLTGGPWGLSTDKPVPGDYDGDDKTDRAMFRESEGVWYISQSSDSSFRAQQWGFGTDKPVPMDYDGDGKTDVAVFRPSDGFWYILQSSDNSFKAQQWGSSEDKPVPGDYDGDGKIDLAVFRPSTGSFYILQSSNNTFRAQQWGLGSDLPIVGDYDGDGKTDLTVYRASEGIWYIMQSSSGTFRAESLSVDCPLSGDYDGDGTTDVAGFRRSDKTWHIRRSFGKALKSQYFGADNDTPVQTYYSF